MASKIIYLHIGFPKTGTSAVQDFFIRNRDRVRSTGYLYPSAGLTPYAGQAGLAMAAKQKLSDPFQVLKSEIDCESATKVILSSEYFFMLSPQEIEFLREQLQGFDVRPIVYFRRQDKRIESGYLQVLRDVEFRFTGDIYDYIEFLRRNPRRINYLSFLDPWAAVFGKNNIVVKVYEEEVRSGGLIPSFLEVCGMPGDERFKHPGDKVNVAFKPVLNRVLRSANKLPLNKRTYLGLLWVLNFLTRYVIGPGSVAGHQLLSASERAAIQKEFEASNVAVAREYLGREDGVLFPND